MCSAGPGACQSEPEGIVVCVHAISPCWMYSCVLYLSVYEVTGNKYATFMRSDNEQPRLPLAVLCVVS